MSKNNSDQVKGCFNQLNQSGGESRNQRSPTDPTGKETTGQTTSSETRIKIDKNPPTSSENGGEGRREKATKSVENADEHRYKNVRNPPYSASENSRASNQPSQSEPMDTSDVSSLGTRPKPVIELGPSYPIKNLKTMENFSTELNQPIHTIGHTILIDIPFFQSGVIVPYEGGKHVWDANHVKLPHVYQQPASHQKSHASPSRWDVTRQALNRLTKGSFSIGDIETAIMSYNSSNKDKWTFDALYYYGRNVHEIDSNLHVIPKMAKLALDLPGLIKRPIPLLRQQQNQAITMSQQQISCLLANAFFCTFPHRNNTSPGSEYANYPTINFSRCYTDHIRLTPLYYTGIVSIIYLFFAIAYLVAGMTQQKQPYRQKN